MNFFKKLIGGERQAQLNAIEDDITTQLAAVKAKQEIAVQASAALQDLLEAVVHPGTKHHSLVLTDGELHALLRMVLKAKHVGREGMTVYPSSDEDVAYADIIIKKLGAEEAMVPGIDESGRVVPTGGYYLLP